MTDLPYTYTDVDGDYLRIGKGAYTAYDPSSRKAVSVTTPTGEDAVRVSRAVLAAASDTGCRVVSQAEVEALQHRPTDRCYYCATDTEMEAALEGRPHPTIHMNLPEGACPDGDTTDTTPVYESLQELAQEIVRLTSERDRLRTAWQSARRRARQQRDALREGMAADRDGLRLTRDRYRTERNTARRYVRILEAQRKDLRQKLRAAEARLPEDDTVDPDDQAPSLESRVEALEQQYTDLANLAHGHSEDLARLRRRFTAQDDG